MLAVFSGNMPACKVQIPGGNALLINGTHGGPILSEHFLYAKLHET
jgi:hypothetical protein